LGLGTFFLGFREGRIEAAEEKINARIRAVVTKPATSSTGIVSLRVMVTCSAWAVSKPLVLKKLTVC
jgi:hypothetical protein